MINEWVMVWLIVGVLMAELSMLQSTRERMKPLAYFFTVTLWPVIVPLAVVVMILTILTKRNQK